jgi:hypothetical protein
VREVRGDKEREQDESGTRTGGGGEVPPVGGLIEETQISEDKVISRKEDIMHTSNKDEQDKDTKKFSNQTPESEEKQHLNGPVNVDKPGWKSSQGDQGSGVSEAVSPVNVDTSGWKSSQGGQGSGVLDFETGRDMPMNGQNGEEETSGEKNVSGIGTDVGGEVASVGGQIPGPEDKVGPNQPISPSQESSEAFARIGSVATCESHQPGPAVEPLLGG